MSKAPILLLLILAASIGFVSSQDVLNSPADGAFSTTPKLYDATEGNMYRHIYSTAIYTATSATLVETTTSSLSINGTMMVGLFDSTQTISYATALTKIEVKAAGSLDTTSKQLILEVVNVTINSARTQFTINLRFTRNEISTFSKYNELGFNVIFFGSNFGIENNPIQAGFARNGKMVDVNDKDSGLGKAQFDFASNEGDLSPFAYVPTSTNNRCGVSYSGTQARIEVLGCTKPIMLSFITGFVHKTETLTELDIGSLIVLDNAATNPDALGIIPTLNTVASNPEYIYQASATDTVVGPTIIFTQGTVTKPVIRLQLSLVFIGLKSITATTYPVGAPESFIVAVGGANYVLGAGIGSGSTILKDGIKSPNAAGIPLDFNKYHKTVDTNMGHSFCGFTTIVSSTNVKLNEEVVNTPGSPSTQIPKLKETVNTATSAAACLFISTSAACVNDEKQIFSPTGTTPATTGVVVTYNTLAAAVNAKNLYSYTVGNYSGLSTSTTSIIKDYPIPAGKTELSFYIETKPNANPAANTLSYILNIGGVEYPAVFLSTTAFSAPTVRQVAIHVPAGTTNLNVNVTFITVAGSGTTSTEIFSGLFYFDKVVDANGNCVSACPEVANKTTGVTIATNPPACIYCNAELFQTYDNDTGACVCRKSYTKDPVTLLCTPCTDPLCAICSPAATCTNCTANATLVPGVTPSCVCNDGFYRSGSTCLPCPIGCATCNSPTACTSCKNSANATGFVTRLTETSNCRCLDGFYETNVSAVCLPCNPLCATCAVSANNCTSCNASLNFVLQQGSCACAAGYYLLNNKCALCSPVCTTCAVSSVYCLTCPDLRVLSGTSNPQFKTCSCNTTAGFVELDYVCIDATCTDVDKNCQTCAVDATGLRLRECLNCIDNRIVIQGKCVCKPGFYELNGKCVACGSGCQSCTSATTCDTCATGSSPVGDGTCACRTGTILVSFSASLYCQPCDINCATCSVAPTNCTSCKTGFSKSPTSNTCVCNPGTYISADGTQCFPCISNCLSCTNSTYCSNCASGYIYDSSVQQCTLNCPDGKFNAGSECKSCPVGCLSCYTEQICSSCLPGYSMFAGSCRSNCPEGTYSLSGQCYPCDAKCKSCSSPTVCTSCTAQYVLFAGKCASDCQPGTFYAAGSCRACNLANCLTCTGTADNCLSCPPPKILYNGACYTSCPVATVNGQCTPNCPAGTFLSGNACAPCDSACKTCFGSATNCTSCASGLSQNGVCIDSCPTGTIASNGFCVNCDPSCKTCSLTPYSCDECASGFIRSGAYCIKNCAAGFYIDVASKTCNPCGDGCATCVSATQCSRCLDPAQTAVNGVCRKVCPSGASLVNGACVCNFGVLHQSTCVTTCPEGFYTATDRTCALCTSPCLGCSGSPTTCTSCIAGFTLDPISRTCSRASTCNYGAYLNSNGQCVNICTTGFFYAGGCVFQCPTGFTANANRGCVQSVTPTFCQSPLFLQGNACVATCLTGFYPNTVTRTCDRCFENCAQCLSATVCVACSAGFTLNAAQSACVTSSTCPANQFSYNGACLAQCPFGTYVNGRFCVRSCRAGLYLYQNFCYPGCPTPFFTADACFTVCPAGVTCQTTP